MAGVEESPPECFICTESSPSPRRSACKCTDRYVHDACLVRMLETASDARCPVCLEPYANVESKICVVSVRLYSTGGCVCSMVLAATVLLGCAINTYAVLANDNQKLSGLTVGFVCGAAVMMTVLALGLAGFVARTVVVWGVKRLVQTAIKKKLVVRIVSMPVELELGELVAR